MFLNCGQVRRASDGAARIDIWDGDEAYEFRISLGDLRRLLQDEKPVPVGRRFGVLENPNYGLATLSWPNEAGKRKGVMLRMDCFKGRKFSVARAALANVARGKWREAVVSEMIPGPVPLSGTIRMGVVR